MEAKIFRLNDYDWYIGRDMQSCKEHYMKETGLNEEEAFDEPEELSEQILQDLIFNNESGEIDYLPKEKMTFKTAMEFEIKNCDRDYPYLFASTEQ